MPVQVLEPETKEGVIFTVATTGFAPVFTAVKDGIVDVVFVLVSPILGIEFVQVKFVATPLKLTAAATAPLHTMTFGGSITLGVGNTPIVNVVVFPLQVSPPPIYCEVAVMEALLIVVPEFVPINGAIVPVPLKPMPIVALVFVQA